MVSEQEVALRHGQHVGGLAGQQLAVGADLVGLGVDLDRRASRALWIIAALPMPPRVFSHRAELALQAELLADALVDGGLRDEGARRSPRPRGRSAPNIGR